VALGQEDDILKDTIELYKLHEHFEGDPDQLKQIFLRKMLLHQLSKYPSHFETFSSCSLNKKILTIRDKISKMKGQEFKKTSGYGF
jgi:hypothetical protein